MKNEETTFGGRRESQLYNLEFIVLKKASAAHLQDSFDSSDSCSKKHSRLNYINLTTNLPNPTNIYHVATYKIR